MKKVALILSGCGYLDGTEINEGVLTLLTLDKVGAHVTCFAPKDKSLLVKNHITDEEQQEGRNILIESARIARGDVSDLSGLEAEHFDGIVIPGGFGVMQNLFNFNGKQEVIPKLKDVLIDFWRLKKAIATLCISPALVVSTLKDHTTVEVTIGEDTDNFIQQLGGKNFDCDVKSYHHDKVNNIFSTPAYMIPDARIRDVEIGIGAMINAFVGCL